MDAKLTALVLLLGAASPSSVPVHDELAEMPWLHNLLGAHVTSTPVASEDETAWSAETECGTGAAQRLELVTDIAATAGKETLRASLDGGLVLRDSEGHVLAQQPGYDCIGTADEISALATGSAFLDRTIALAVTHGGHREQSVELAMFRVSEDGRIAAVFTAEVEFRDGETARRGGVWLLPGALIYQRPTGRPTLWTFDTVVGAYLYRGAFEQEDAPLHAEPPPMF